MAGGNPATLFVKGKELNLKYTQAQVRSLVGLNEETFRHWRKALPPLQGHQGHAATFSLGDILALSVIHRLTAFMEGKVSRLPCRPYDLFEICEQIADGDERSAILLVTPGHVIRFSPNSPNQLNSIAFLIPVGRLLSTLRSAIQGDPTTDLQLFLPLGAGERNA
jgi:hypothetical protein